MKLASTKKYILPPLLAVAITPACSPLENPNEIAGSNDLPNTTITSRAKPWIHKAKQDSVWSCHSFVATGLLEAKYFEVRGKRIDLSEADLFLKHIKQESPDWNTALTHYFNQGTSMKSPRNLEAGYVDHSFRLIQKHGVAYEKEFKYSPIGRLGLPLTMSILRQSVKEIKKDVKAGESQSSATQARIEQLKQDGAYKYILQEEKPHSSRLLIQQFANQYNIKKTDIRNQNNAWIIKKALKSHQAVGLTYKVPSNKNRLVASSQHHTLIISGYDERKKHFIIRDSDSRGLYGKYDLTPDFVERFAIKLFVLESKR